MIGPFVIAEPKGLLLADQHFGAVVNPEHCFLFVQEASALAHGPEHRLSFDLAPPYFSFLPRDFLWSVVLIYHMLHMFKQLLFNPRGRIRQEVGRLGLNSSILIALYLLDPIFLLLDMNIRRIGAVLGRRYMVFTPLAGVNSF